MGKWRLWHSANSFGQYIVGHTILSDYKDEIDYKLLPESDAAKGGDFHRVPDHIKKILYLDAADVIVEYDSEPVVCIEETKEAGTGHDPLQRFARMAAAVENNVPAIYIMPEAVIPGRRGKKKWDVINPMVFRAFHRMMDIFKIPALFFYFPSDYREYPNPSQCPNQSAKGLRFSNNIPQYSACPDENDTEMQLLFEVLNVIFSFAMRKIDPTRLMDEEVIRNRRDYMYEQFYGKLKRRKIEKVSPLTATLTISTTKLLKYLSTYSQPGAESISELLESRPQTVIYKCNSVFRSDPYTGVLAALDYLMCRTGKTYEDRKNNLVLCFGEMEEMEDCIKVTSTKNSVNDFIRTVQNSGKKNLLTAANYSEIGSKNIGRYYMQVRYGSTYSKAKHIRIFSYFADAIIFKDGALWREA